jgi:GWxTD domain-containing protein
LGLIWPVPLTAESGRALDHHRPGAKAFKSLSNDEERDNFIEQFWLRRNPNPDSPENEFREEHYRRIAYANEHFAAGKPGWKTDRGHIYISFGKPDRSIRTPAAAATSVLWTRAAARPRPSHLRPGTTAISKALATTSTLSSSTPASAATITSPSIAGEGRAVARFPAPDSPSAEQMGRPRRRTASTAAWRTWARADVQHGQQSQEFDRIELAAKLIAPPPIKFKDLDLEASSPSTSC